MTTTSMTILPSAQLALMSVKFLRIIQETCEELGVPLAIEKLEGPTTRLTLLGIEPPESSDCLMTNLQGSEKPYHPGKKEVMH